MKSKLEALFFAAITGLVIVGTTVIGLFAFLFFGAALAAVVGAVIYLAWNYAAVPLFGAPCVTFFQVWLLCFATDLVAARAMKLLRRRA